MTEFSGIIERLGVHQKKLKAISSFLFKSVLIQKRASCYSERVIQESVSSSIAAVRGALESIS